jgi:hypothetical protein
MTLHTTEDLRPCPICGGPATLYPDQSGAPWIACDDPKDGCVTMDGRDGFPEEGIPHETHAELRARWNRRTDPPARELADLERVAAAVATERRAIAAWLDHRGLPREAKLVRAGAHHPELTTEPA